MEFRKRSHTIFIDMLLLYSECVCEWTFCFSSSSLSLFFSLTLNQILYISAVKIDFYRDRQKISVYTISCMPQMKLFYRTLDRFWQWNSVSCRNIINKYITSIFQSPAFWQLWNFTHVCICCCWVFFFFHFSFFCTAHMNSISFDRHTVRHRKITFWIYCNIICQIQYKYIK